MHLLDDVEELLVLVVCEAWAGDTLLLPQHVVLVEDGVKLGRDVARLMAV